MPAIIELPSVVQEVVAQYGEVFANEPERRHFGEYILGLMIAERKTVSGIHREFAETTDQSCLNRFLTQAKWDVGALNRRRLEWLQEDPTWRDSKQGVIAIDNTLIDHEGKLIADLTVTHKYYRAGNRRVLLLRGRSAAGERHVGRAYGLF
jgi:SRSO17 transposase